jgi:hypothetical protein
LRREGLREEKRRLEIYGDRTLEACRRQCLDIVRLEFSGIVDQKREPAECDGSRHEAANGVVIGKVGKNNVGLAARSHDRGRKPLRVIARIVGMQHHRITRTRQGKRDRRTNSAAGTGDQRRASGSLWIVSHRTLPGISARLHVVPPIARSAHAVRRQPIGADRSW